ncbi:MAG: tetratricopeptide repeat protein [Planctomycetes bacterium]|nr:tetratricopeptide repeat protein [Planctomycetota bacterium]
MNGMTRATGRRLLASLLPACGRWRTWLAALVLLALTAVGLAVPYRHWRAEASFAAAEDAYRNARLVEARERLAAYLQSQPNSFAAHLLMARISRRARYYDEAAIHLDICEILPGPADEVTLERDLIQTQQGDLAREAALWSQARRRPNLAPDIFETLAQAYQKNYLLKRMRHCLDSWIALDKNARAHLERGWVREREQDHHGAVADYRQARELDAAAAREARLKAGQALLFLKKPVEALAELEPLADEKTADPKIGLALAQAWHRLGRTDDARILLDALVQEHPQEFAIVLERGRLELEQGDAARAETWLRRAVEQMPHEHSAVYALSQALQRQKKLAEQAKLQKRLKDLEADMDLMADLTARLQNHPADPALRCEIAKIFLRSGENREAYLWLKSALRLDPKHAASHLALAQYYERINLPAIAAGHRQQAGKGRPTP